MSHFLHFFSLFLVLSVLFSTVSSCQRATVSELEEGGPNIRGLAEGSSLSGALREANH